GMPSDTTVDGTATSGTSLNVSSYGSAPAYSRTSTPPATFWAEAASDSFRDGPAINRRLGCPLLRAMSVILCTKRSPPIKPTRTTLLGAPLVRMPETLDQNRTCQCGGCSRAGTPDGAQRGAGGVHGVLEQWPHRLLPCTVHRPEGSR